MLGPSPSIDIRRLNSVASPPACALHDERRRTRCNTRLRIVVSAFTGQVPNGLARNARFHAIACILPGSGLAQPPDSDWTLQQMNPRPCLSSRRNTCTRYRNGLGWSVTEEL